MVAVFGIPGGAEWWIILAVILMMFGPAALIALIVGYSLRPGQSQGHELAVPPAPPGWIADPTGRHQLRFWDGAAWTSAVSDDGSVSDDPV